MKWKWHTCKYRDNYFSGNHKNKLMTMTNKLGANWVSVWIPPCFESHGSGQPAIYTCKSLWYNKNRLKRHHWIVHIHMCSRFSHFNLEILTARPIQGNATIGTSLARSHLALRAMVQILTHSKSLMKQEQTKTSPLNGTYTRTGSGEFWWVQ